MKLKCILCSILASIAVAMLMVGGAFGMPINESNAKEKPLINLTLNESRIVHVNSIITNMAASDFQNDMDSLDNGKDPIYILIDSPGGSIESGLDMIKRMEVAKSPVICVVDGLAASMAALFSASCPTLYTHKYSIVMFHEYSASANGPRKNILSQVQLMEAVWNAICKDMSKKMGLSEAEFRRRSAEDWWFNGYESSRIGFSKATIDKLYIIKSNNIVKDLLKFLTPTKEVQ